MQCKVIAEKEERERDNACHKAIKQAIANGQLEARCSNGLSDAFLSLLRSKEFDTEKKWEEREYDDYFGSRTDLVTGRVISWKKNNKSIYSRCTNQIVLRIFDGKANSDDSDDFTIRRSNKMCVDDEQVVILQSRAQLMRVLSENRHKKVLLACAVDSVREHRRFVQNTLIRNGVVFGDQCFQSVRAMPSANVTDHGRGIVDVMYILRDVCNEAALKTTLSECNLTDCTASSSLCKK